MHRRGIFRALVGLVALVSAPLAVVALAAAPAGATTVSNETEFRAAFANAAETSITLSANITLTCGPPAAAQRTSSTALTIDGGGTFSITQSCANNQNLVQNGSGAINVVGVTLVGGNTGVSSAGGDVSLTDSTIESLSDAASQVTGINAAGSVSLDHSTISGLTGANAALGILSFGSSTSVTNGSSINTVEGTNSGVGVDAATGAVTVSDSTVAEISSGNLAFGVSAGTGSVVVTNSHVGPVTSNGSAFGVLSSADTVTFDSSTVDGVSAGVAPAIGIDAAGAIGVHGSTVANVSSSDSIAVGVQSNSGSVTLGGALVRAITSGTSLAIGIATDTSGSVDATATTLADITGATGAIGISTGVSATLTDSAVETVTSLAGTTAVGVGSNSVALTGSEISGVGSGGVAAGIEADNDLTLTRSTITGTTGADIAFGAEVGATATVVNSTVTDNDGFGVVVEGDLHAVYSDIVGNGAAITPTAAAADAPAQALQVPGGGTVRIPAVGAVHAQASTLGQLEAGGTISLFGTVVTAPVGSFTNCSSDTITSAGYNFADDTSCALTGTGDRQGAGLDPQLGALAFNGGPTQTLAITQTSPLFDAIPAAACQSGPAAGITTDQRGEARPSYTGCDIGAFEIQAPAPVELAPRFTG